MKTFLIIGQSFSNLTEYILKHGNDYILLQDVAKTKHPDKRLKRRVLVDFKSDKLMLQAVDEIQSKIDGVITVYENYILPAAKIARHLRLPHLPVETAEACTDKHLMRQLLLNAPKKISPDFTEVNDERSLISFADAHEFPLILKPANLAKSLLVTKANNMKELLANYNETLNKIDDVYKKYAPNRTPKLIVEEFLMGNIHSVDAFVDADGNPHVLQQIVDYQTGYDIGYDDNFHYSRILPTKLSAKDQVALREVAELGCRALGMKNSPAHIEIIMTKDGPRIVEIGARNGGYRERMHRLANGIDITGAALQLALGKKPGIKATKNEFCAVLELFPKKPGLFNGIKNIKQLERLSSLKYLKVKAKHGEFVGKAGDGYKMCAVVILHNPDQRQFSKDLDFVNNDVTITTLFD